MPLTPTEATIALKSVRALLGEPAQPARYWIPSYQRGYRWTRVQVAQLLDDIWDFIETPGAQHRFYCLQPIVVKKHPDGRIEVVDGQQRLTTIHIILLCLRDIAKLLTKTFFELKFETRNDPARPSLDNIDPSQALDNPDYYHACEAYAAVQEWCSSHDESYQLKLIQHLLNADTAGPNVRVIWFELGPNDNVVEAFTRLNVGKIRLTDDELIRALFLGNGHGASPEEATIKTQIAHEWDLIEKALQAPDFWAFLTEDRREQNRIGHLFELMAQAEDIPPEARHDEYWVFHVFSDRLRKSTLEREWLRIKQEFMRFQEWFEDERRVAYHIIGFLVTQSVEMAEIRRLSEQCTKSEFHRRLRERVYQWLTGNESVPAEPELRAIIASYLDGLEYSSDKQKKRIRAVLLLFNIASLLENPRSNLRFNFAAFKDRSFNWDLEHIRSQASDRINNRPEWLEGCHRFLSEQPDPQSRSLAEQVEAQIALGDRATTENFASLRLCILEHLKEASQPEERNDLSNLTLLDSGTNRGYKNAPFAVKRRTILAVDKAGVFVPLCTRNVFLKAYSADAGNAIVWSNKDADDYEEAVINTLVGFFLGKEVET